MTHLAVVDPAVRVPELDCFNRIALHRPQGRSPIPATYHLPALFGLDSLRRVDDGLAGVVVLGSGASPNDSLPWQDELGEWLARKLAAGVPVLGLCYGHQLVARVSGGAVGFLHEDRAKERGVREVPLASTRLWSARTAPLVVSHREVVTRAPPGFRVVGSTPVCAIEAMEHESRPVWTFQAHPEATAAFLANNGVPWPLPEAELAHGHALVDAFLDAVAAGTG